MPKQQQSIFSWQLVDDEQTWRELTANSANSSNKPSVRPRHWFLSAAVFALVLVSLLGAHLYHRARIGLAQVQSELATAVDTESWAASSGSQAVRQGVLDPAAPDIWRSRILMEHAPIAENIAGGNPPADVRPVLFRDVIALVQVRERSTAGSVYVEHRFYRETEDGWVRTTPRPALWGPMRSHETRFFRFYFHEQDAVAVNATADRIDDFYAGLREDLGLPLSDDAEKLSIYVTVPEAPQLDMLSLFFVGNRLEVPSPKLLPVLESATPSQALEQTIDQALIQSLVQQPEMQLEVRNDRYPLLDGMRLWQLRQANHQAEWYTANVRWLYTEWPAIHRGDRVLRVGEADWLCHVTYGGTPLIANRLLSDDCGDSDPAHLMQDMPFPPQQLVDLEMIPSIPTSAEQWVHRWQQLAILASIVDYAVTTYGRHTLPLLLQAMSVYDDWETLIPAVFDVSVEEFEAGWHAYLKK